MKGIKKFFETPRKTLASVVCIIIILALAAGIFVSIRVFTGKKFAQKIAFADAGVDRSAVRFVRTEVDFEHWQFMYEIDFIADGTEYEYLIKASDGTIIKKEADGRNRANADSGTEPQAGADANGGVTLDEAKAFALADAGLAEADVTFTKIGLDMDSGISVYDIEFYTSVNEYEYEINAETGAVRSKEIEVRQAKGPESQRAR